MAGHGGSVLEVVPLLIMEVSNKEATSRETTSKGTTSKEGANNQITKDPIAGGVPDTLLQVMALVTIVTTTEGDPHDTPLLGGTSSRSGHLAKHVMTVSKYPTPSLD
uniref:Uncharacterized protein n=1 Tax=Timema cristinae TaxID=61476 RepID=A0A7R9CSQ3_TIMCR|nr:unnamed protein product [Timema cristinae]